MKKYYGALWCLNCLRNNHTVTLYRRIITVRNYHSCIPGDNGNKSMLGQCWSSVYDAGPTLTRHWLNVACLLGSASEGDNARWMSDLFHRSATKTPALSMHVKIQLNWTKRKGLSGQRAESIRPLSMECRMRTEQTAEIGKPCHRLNKQATFKQC